MSEKPLHVQVAEALDWTNCYDRGDGFWLGDSPDGKIDIEVPAFDRSWCAAGPLISKFEISIHPMIGKGYWWAEIHDVEDEGLEAAGVPRAVSELIVKLHKQGKLKA